MTDPRESVIGLRLEGVGRIVAVTGGKGGIGKSFVSATMALALADRGLRVGLLDLDFTSPSAHVILGFEVGFPTEEFGIDPPVHAGIHTMSIAHFAGETPAPMRGEDSSSALLELLAITNWGQLDVLVIDMPPGLGDAALDAIRLLPRASYVVVATASPVALASVRRATGLLGRTGADILGVVENMARDDGGAVSRFAAEIHRPFLGRVPYDPEVETAFGNVAKLRTTDAFHAIASLGLPVD